MAKKPHEPGEEEARSSDQFARTVKESAQQIWLAGLGALARAQEEGSKVFESLVKEGAGMQRRTQAAAEEKLAEAGNRMSSMADELSSRASGQWDRLEQMFEEHVPRALKRLGVPTAREFDALSQRVQELHRSVEALRRGGSAGRTAARKSPAKAPAAKRAATKVARKRAPARKGGE